jgi:hypothetical protein
MPMTHTLNDCFSNEAAIDGIIATCDGDTRGAISFLLLVNEQLVTELRQLDAAFEHGSPSEGRVKKLLH